MKLFIQIPCYNEQDTIGIVLDELPDEIDGFDEICTLIIDDGSVDDTVKVALAHGVNYVVKHTSNQGLANSFMSGIDASLSLGADVIVNTDADNQYNANDIPLLTKPILDREADIVIGERPISDINHFTFLKKQLQKLGSWVVRFASNTDVPDAPSGFRAFSRKAAQNLTVFNDYTYTLETIIQAGRRNFAIKSVLISVNPDLRPSRLVSSIPAYIKRSATTIIRIFVVYHPFKFFIAIGAFLFLTGFCFGLRFLYFYISGEGSGHVQSLILSSVLLGMGFQTILTAFLADLLSANRKLLEDIRFRQKTGNETRVIKNDKHITG